MELLPGKVVKAVYKFKTDKHLPHIIILKPKQYSPEFYDLAQLFRLPIWNDVMAWFGANMQPLDWTTEWHSNASTPLRIFAFRTKEHAFLFKLVWC